MKRKRLLHASRKDGNIVKNTVTYKGMRSMRGPVRFLA